MKFPIMNKRPRQAVVVPELSGGLNLRDSVSMINDNQLTDCKNVWFKDGVLKTRAGISGTELFSNENQSGDFKAHDIYTFLQGEICRLFSQVDQYKKIINFHWMGETVLKSLPSISDFEGSYFLVKKDEFIYFFCAKGIYKCDTEKEEWVLIDQKDIYAPTIATNVDCFYVGFNKDNDVFLRGDMLESFNLLGNRYKFLASTVSKSALDPEYKEHLMKYAIPFSKEVLDLVPEILEVTITYIDGKVATHTAKKVEYGSLTVIEEEDFQQDNLKMKVVANLENKKDNILVIEFYDKENQPGVVKEADYVSNNMEIIAPCLNSEKNISKVLKMAHCTWFGGDSAGINGGTRLFLGGNTEEPNLVIWSDLNNPLYFPENNYFYVGESSSAVTAFGKQSDMLVIFKEDETYFTQYNRNSGIEAKDLIDQTVVDYIGSSVYFPLTLINANIGCDCPDSVQLCRNRLVWACSEGKIYTLVSNNQYSERNIFEISEMVQKRLKTQSNLKKAHSSDWNGYYLLQVGSDVYVLDYNSYGYQYVSSYSKTEDANIRIPWYYWEFVLSHGESTPSVIATIDKDLKIINSGSRGIFVGEISENSNYDNMLLSADTTANYGGIEKPIECYISTKLFEFGAVGYRKNVDKVMLSLGNNGGAPIKAEFITDEGTEEEFITLEGENTEPYSPGYVKSVPLNPCIRSVERFGVKLTCEGPLAVDGITLFYRVLGGVK